MPNSVVQQAIEEQRSRLLAHEADTMRTMVLKWQGVEDKLRADMLDLSIYLDEQSRKGVSITPERLMQMERYQNLVAQARNEQEKYSLWAASSISADQNAQISQGIANATKLLYAAGVDQKVQDLVFDHINRLAVEYAIGYAADGTPLYALLKASYAKSVLKLTDALVQGIAAGLGPKATADLMAKYMGGNLDRALLIAITEQNRALRAGTFQQMRMSGVVVGYKRAAQRNSKVCAACLAADGEALGMSEEFSSHPRCHCFAVPILRYGSPLKMQTGKEWFVVQPEATQREILGSTRYNRYKSGKLDWGSLAEVHQDPVWGPTLRVGTGVAM